MHSRAWGRNTLKRQTHSNGRCTPEIRKRRTYLIRVLWRVCHRQRSRSFALAPARFTEYFLRLFIAQWATALSDNKTHDSHLRVWSTEAGEDATRIMIASDLSTGINCCIIGNADFSWQHTDTFTEQESRVKCVEVRYRTESDNYYYK